MEENSCTHCENTNCIFKNLLSQHAIEIEKFNIQKGLNVYLEDMPVKGLYIVQRGSINEYNIDKKKQKEICQMAKSGDVFGHKDLNATKHLFNAVAIENSSICLINKSKLLEICQKNPKQSIKLINFFTDELNKSAERYSLI